MIIQSLILLVLIYIFVFQDIKRNTFPKTQGNMGMTAEEEVARKRNWRSVFLQRSLTDFSVLYVQIIVGHMFLMIFVARNG